MVLLMMTESTINSNVYPADSLFQIYGIIDDNRINKRYSVDESYIFLALSALEHK
jgi:hypothetical protein